MRQNESGLCELFQNRAAGESDRPGGEARARREDRDFGDCGSAVTQTSREKKMPEKNRVLRLARRPKTEITPDVLSLEQETS